MAPFRRGVETGGLNYADDDEAKAMLEKALQGSHGGDRRSETFKSAISRLEAADEENAFNLHG